MEKIEIDRHKNAILYKCTRINRFTGCQCISDCFCREEFGAERSIEFWKVKTRYRSKDYCSIEEAMNYFNFMKLVTYKDK